MRIAYIAIKGIPIGGGIEKLTEEIGSRLVRKGHEVLVYSSRDYGASDGELKGMQIRTVPSINTKALHKLSICLAATQDVIRRNNVDVVHVHAVGPSVFSIFPRLWHIPTVVQTHGLEWKRDKWGPIGKAFFRLSDYTAIYFPNRTTSVSKVQKSYYEKKYRRKIVYIPPGVELPATRRPDWILQQGLLPNRYVLFAGRLVEEKGAHYLIDAFRSIRTDLKLVIAGDAAHSDKYKHILRQKTAADPRVIFTGFVTGKPLQELFSNAYLFCLPSTIEGLPIALLEAMSYGNCCLASDIPENLEALESHGFTFKSRHAEDLRRVLSDLLESPEKVNTKKEAAKRHVLRNYAWDTIADQMEALYFSVVSKDQDTKARLRLCSGGPGFSSEGRRSELFRPLPRGRHLQP
jgi:glycosyltransferase involved in cell wall biosynthesis